MFSKCQRSGTPPSRVANRVEVEVTSTVFLGSYQADSADERRKDILRVKGLLGIQEMPLGSQYDKEGSITQRILNVMQSSEGWLKRSHIPTLLVSTHECIMEILWEICHRSEPKLSLVFRHSSPLKLITLLQSTSIQQEAISSVCYSQLYPCFRMVN